MNTLRNMGLFLIFSVLTTLAQTSLIWDPGTSQTGTEVFVNSDMSAGLHLFEITTTNSANNVGFWRTVLNVESGEADLYISTSAAITTNSYTEKSDTSGSDWIVRSLSPGQTWYLLVDSAANSDWRLFAGDMHVKELTWDPGSAQSGTEVYSHPNTREGSYLFRITTTNTPASLGYWRAVLDLSGGNADLFTDPDANISPNNYQYKSDQTGSDTIVQALTAGQEKYILVDAQEGASWSLFAGDIHLTELTWDPGTTGAGTEVFNNLNTDGGHTILKSQRSSRTLRHGAQRSMFFPVTPPFI
ncbi:hypothetical protein P4E94_08340 [Pontiellaceae bacterium B12219]|nr:hypothetical protein [Pontiellaceae bacterium B12219]